MRSSRKHRKDARRLQRRRNQALSHLAIPARGRKSRRRDPARRSKSPHGVPARMSAAARKLFLTIAVLAIAGVAVSSVSLDHHFRKSKTPYCDYGQSFNCDIVNRSEYSTVAGVPVALIGILGYVALLAFATFYREKAETPGILVVGSLGGLGFALYLTYIEKYVLFAWCILCLTSLALILSITVLASALLMRSMRRLPTT